MHTISKFIISSVLICTPQLALTIGSVNIYSHFFLGGFPVPGYATE